MAAKRVEIRRSFSGRVVGCSASRAVYVFAFLFVVIGLAALADQPIAIGEAFPSRELALRVEDETVSQVAYVELTDEASEAWVRFDVEEPGEVFVALGVPAIQRLEGYRPALRLIGPEGESEGVVLEAGLGEQPRLFHEPFTDTDSWIYVEQWVSIAASGTYYVIASADPEVADKLWISIGRREVFGVADVFSLPAIIRDVRVFHEVPAPTALAQRDWAALLGILVVGGIVLFAALGGFE